MTSERNILAKKLRASRRRSRGESRPWQLQTELAARGLELGEAVSVSHMIEAASDRVWQVISQPGQLTRYHPFCQATTVIKWPGVWAKDTVTYYSGVHYERDFVTWIEETLLPRTASYSSGDSERLKGVVWLGVPHTPV